MPQPDLRDRVESVLRRNGVHRRHLLLGLSGGLDSVVLLDVLADLRVAMDYRLSAIHINHGLSENADAWARYCRRLCRGRAVPIKVVKIQVPRVRGQSLEAAARNARYLAYQGSAEDLLVLAQHLDDQAETVLLQLLRGAGVKGMSAMPELREQGNLPILRPLLEVSRRELQAYAEQRSLEWVEDESNANIDFDRNFLRHRVLPVIEERFPGYRGTLSRASRHLAEAGALLDQLAQMDMGQGIHGARMDLAPLRNLEPMRARNALRYFIVGRQVALPSAERLAEMLRQLLSAKPDAQVRIAFGDHEMRRFGDQMFLVARRPLTDQGQVWTWRGERVLSLPELGGRLQFQRVRGRGVGLKAIGDGGLRIQLRQGGERLRPVCGRPSRSLKNLCQELGIPPWQRDSMPLLYHGQNLVCIPDVGVECAYQAQPGQPGVLVRWDE
jgi:tRNA(Ile)-lysidine synthase